MYGHVATATGWTFSQINDLTLWDLHELLDYWQDYPPTHVLVGAYLMGGTKRRRSRSSGRREGVDLAELRQVVVTAGGQIDMKLPEVYRNAVGIPSRELNPRGSKAHGAAET